MTVSIGVFGYRGNKALKPFYEFLDYSSEYENFSEAQKEAMDNCVMHKWEESSKTSAGSFAVGCYVATRDYFSEAKIGRKVSDDDYMRCVRPCREIVYDWVGLNADGPQCRFGCTSLLILEKPYSRPPSGRVKNARKV